MTRSQMIETVARKTGFPESQVEMTMDAPASPRLTPTPRPRCPAAWSPPRFLVSRQAAASSRSWRLPVQPQQPKTRLWKRRRNKIIIPRPDADRRPAFFCALRWERSLFRSPAPCYTDKNTRTCADPEGRRIACSTVNYSAVRPSTRRWSGWALTR